MKTVRLCLLFPLVYPIALVASFITEISMRKEYGCAVYSFRELPSYALQFTLEVLNS